MDLMAFGRVFLEIVFGQVPSLPGPGEEIFADEFAISCGGAVTVAGRYGIQAGLPTLRSDDLGSGVTRGYGRELVEAAVTGDAGPAALALAVHPLVPGVTVARGDDQ